ncbi:MAG: Glu-tRNA(Gln) amidotransferase subunit GatD [Nanoarchaeota archaeon]|nr:Glu-tRNA(Gln) amidotransferase subunit GatD [Nanoarchaeota archaeon]
MKKEADIGYTVEIFFNGLNLHGTIINEEEGNIFLKLKSGYDVVIPKNKIKKLKILQRGEKKEAEIENKIGDKNFDIKILTTGGTIDSKIDYVTGGVSPGLSASDYIKLAPEIMNYGKISIEKIMSILSENIQVKDWIKIAKKVNEAISAGGKGVVVTMGTDTMHYTASMLSFMLNPLSVPLIFTGAQRSSDRGSSDASINLLTSVIAASKVSAGESMICMHATMNDSYNFLLRGNRTRKMHTERRDAFRPINSRPIAKVFPNGNIEMISQPIKPGEKTHLDTKVDENVKMILTYPGFNADDLDFYLKENVSGIVIQGTGFGNIPMGNKSVYNSIVKAHEKEIPIVITSQTIYGRTNRFVYSTLREISKFENIIYVEDMLPETAFTKLMFVLGHTHKIEKVKELMERPLAGEMSERSEIDTFLI